MSVKIFFTDLDSTLLTTSKEVSPKTRAMLEKWTTAGHKLVLCSGRALDSVIHVRNTLQLHYDNMYLIGCNGGEIYDCSTDTLLYKVTLSRETVMEAFSIAKEHGIYLQTYSPTHILTTTDGPELAYYHQTIHTPHLVAPDIASLLTEAPCKCLAIELTNGDKLERFRQDIEKRLSPQLTVLYSNPRYLELFPSSSGKGTGVKWLCTHLGLPISDSLAAGDEINDLSMLEAAGLGIAMKNAREAVKKAADVITPADNDHDGLVPVLETVMQQ